MQKEFFYSSQPETDAWDEMWEERTVEQELEACDMESPPRDLFLSWIPRTARIVDAGCGLGKWVMYLKRLGYDIVGIDSNEMALAKLRDSDGSLRLELGNVLEIGYPDDYFDAYISMGVVEHFEDGPQLALKEAHRVLKPGGLVFVSVPTVNVLRKFFGRSLRNLIKACHGLFVMLRSPRDERKRKAGLGAVGAAMPRRVKSLLLRRPVRYCFSEYKYSRSELRSFLEECGFEVLNTVPHDFFGSADHSIGLALDFPFLRAKNSVNFRLNLPGRLVSRILNKMSPWIACSSVLCVGRSSKGQPLPESTQPTPSARHDP
jgi:SAM-dependent methyltransferase